MKAASSRIDMFSEILQLKTGNNDLDQESRSAKLRVSGLSVDKKNAKESFLSFCHRITNQPPDIDHLQLIPVKRDRVRLSALPPILLVTFTGVQTRNQTL